LDTTQALITGIVQGLTEFLPISSSGHIVLTSSIYKLLTGQSLASGGSEEIFFDIMLHIGTLVAVLIYFKKDILSLIKPGHSEKIPFYILLGTISTILVAFPLKDHFESLIYNPAAVGLILMVTGTLLFATEHISQKLNKNETLIGWKRALIIGAAQGLAVAPGLSRSGSTIAAGLATGLDRVTAARYSFLLSIPIIAMAGAYHSIELGVTGGFSGFNWVAIMLGTLVSAVVGYYCIKYFIIFITKNKLHVFGLYCWIVGLLMAIFFSVNGSKAAATIEIKEANMKITSTAFAHNEFIPPKYTCDGQDAAPPLSVAEIPENAESLALIADDPDAPMGTWVHWVMYNIPPSTVNLDENSGAQGINDFKKTGYGGPCPPGGTHRYFFKIYALDKKLDLSPGATKAQLEHAMNGHIIDSGELKGLYKRK